MRRYQKDLLLLTLAACVLVVGLFFWNRNARRPLARTLRMTAGDATGLRHRLAQEFAREAEAQGIRIDLSATEGSEVALEKLEAGEFDIAMVQGGIATSANSPVRQISPLHIEPLHLLVKPELYATVLEGGLSKLAGHKINLGAKGSGTAVLAHEVLHFAGLSPSTSEDASGYVTNSQAYSDLIDAQLQDLPEAVFTVSTLPSPIADALVEKHGFRLIPLAFGDAFAIEATSELGKSVPLGAIDKQHVFTTSIPPFTYSLNRNEPSTTLTTLGTRLLLVANKDVPGESVKQLLDFLFRSNLVKVARPALDASLLDLPSEYPMHVGAESFRQRNKPIIAGDAIDYLEKVLAIAATVAGGTFFLVQWYIGSNRKRRESSLAKYMERVIAIERESMHIELAAQLDLASLIRLQRELAELKAEAVTRFAAGKLEGVGMISGFLGLVNDTRDQMTRLILHQRENIEQLAAQQHTKPGEVWLEQSHHSLPDTMD